MKYEIEVVVETTKNGSPYQEFTLTYKLNEKFPNSKVDLVKHKTVYL